ncbi:MAG: ComF family protein [Lachnospiraceae bacterium]|nr:ComF family protein [Lachnospiraceae bacterium]
MKCIREKFNRWLDYLYPRTCPVCTKVLAPGRRLVCEECQSKLVYVKNPRCKKCGKPVENGVKEFCGDCNRKKHYYNSGRVVWVYTKEMRQSIYRFKYDNKREYADFYVTELVRLYGGWIKRLDVDAIIPVPLHKSKYRKRGFNQAQVLAEAIGRQLEIPVLSDILVRNKNTTAQKNLNDKQRQENVKNAFKIINNEVQLKKILLVDDIYTTGSTIDAVARILKGDGVKEVYFICLCTSGVN